MKWNVAAMGRHWVTRWWFVVAIVWLLRFALLGHILPWQQPIWRDWFDQSRYLASATAFAHGDLGAGAHWYPLGYPLLAAPFAWITPRDPFLILDLLLVLSTCRAFQNVAARIGIGVWPATICFIATTLFQSGLASAWVHPWTTTLSAALIWWLIDRTAAVMVEGNERRAPRLLSFGMLAAALPLVRPVDALISLVCMGAILATLICRRQLSLRTFASLCGGGLIVIAPYILLHLAIYGPHPTPYMIAAAGTGFIWSDLGWKAYVMLVEARPWYPDSDAILRVLPWIVPGMAGLIAGAATGTSTQRRICLLLLALVIPVGAITLTYADLQPPGLWRFFNIHYFKWMMPAFGAGVLLAWRMLWRRGERRLIAAELVALAILLCLRIVPVAVDDHMPARMLTFRGATDRVWDEAYFAPVTINDDLGRMENVRNFHQMPDVQGERAIAISRWFGGNPQRRDPGETGAAQPQRPDARYGERFTFLGW